MDCSAFRMAGIVGPLKEECAVACPQCGGRMLAKVGRKPVRLVCADCGTPLDERQRLYDERRRWGALLGVLVLVLTVGLIFYLAIMSEDNRNQDLETQPESRLGRSIQPVA